MDDEVIVTRKGQTTIPIKLRAKYQIEEGTRLQVLDTNDGILLRPKQSTLDLAGSGARYASPDQMKKLLEKLRDLDA
jgi:AbrB family looped-hinge helix DNA binding protein